MSANIAFSYVLRLQIQRPDTKKAENSDVFDLRIACYLYIHDKFMAVFFNSIWLFYMLLLHMAYGSTAAAMPSVMLSRTYRMNVE